MSSPDFSYGFDANQRTAMVSANAQVRDLIHQLLFTTPGERVMRPDFGSGLLQLTFEPNSEELASATRMLVVAALQETLSDHLVTNDVQIFSEGGDLEVTVDYTVLATQTRVITRLTGAHS